MTGAILYSNYELIELARAPRDYITGAGSALIIITAISSPFLRRLLTTRPVQFLGEVSYSLYLVHMPITLFTISWVFPPTRSALLCASISLIGSLAIATAFRRWIEIPGMQWLRQRNELDVIFPAQSGARAACGIAGPRDGAALQR
jgi:peptidoglycan/LPS O-acetylase OafA/YrhL